MAMVLENPSLQDRLRAVARPGENLEMLFLTIVEEGIARREREAARLEADRAEAHAILAGPFRPHDPQATYQSDREKYSWTQDSSNLTDEELATRFDAGIAALPPEKIAEAQRLGFL